MKPEGKKMRIADIRWYLGVAGILGLTFSMGWMLVSSRALANDAVQTSPQVTVSSSCQLDSEETSAHEAEVVASTYKADIGETTITATCNDANGYAIYAVGYTNTELGRNDLLGASMGRTIATGTATSGDTSNWAMKLTAVSGTATPTIVTGYDAYHAVPSEYTKVASYANSTMESATGSQMKTTYAAFVAGTQVPDVYNGKVKYTLIHPTDSTETPCVGKYTINYNSNGGSGNMDSQEACVDRPISLLPSGFTPPVPVAENQFANWNTAADGSGYVYTAGQSVTNLASAGGSITLYAQWAPKYIQDLTTTTCQAMTNDTPLTVYDRRDGSDYTVRYINGACWMTQNLRITGVINSSQSNFSSSDNLNVSEYDLKANSDYMCDTARGSSNVCSHAPDSSDLSTIGGNYTAEQIGVWYNYAAATAGTIWGSSNTTIATEDICPANWHLPSYDTSSPIGSVNSLAGEASYKNLFSPVVGGFYNVNTISGASNSGYWWSTVARSTEGRYNLGWSTGGDKLSVSSSLGNGGYTRYRGLFVRCVRV